MQGSDSGDGAGMNLRSLRELFRLRDERCDDYDYTFKVSYYEIWCEQLRDLLDPSEKELRIRQGGTGVYVENLTERVVNSAEEVMAAMESGNANRSVSATEMNAHSSRSHSILSVSVSGVARITGMSYLGRLHLIDLAGSERVGRSQATGQQLKEAQAINLSLSNLGNCISGLQKKEAHIPYRNSKLTYGPQTGTISASGLLLFTSCSFSLCFRFSHALASVMCFRIRWAVIRRC